MGLGGGRREAPAAVPLRAPSGRCPNPTSSEWAQAARGRPATTVELEGQIGAQGDGTAQYRGEPVFVPSQRRVTVSGPGSGPAAVAGWKARRRPAHLRAGSPVPDADISGPAVVVPAAPGRRIIPAEQAGDIADRPRTGRDRSRYGRAVEAPAAGTPAGAPRPRPAARSASAGWHRLPRAVPTRTDRPPRMSGARTRALRPDRQAAAGRPRLCPAGRIGGGDADPHRQRHRSADRGGGAAGPPHMRDPCAVRRGVRPRPHRLALWR